MLLDSRGRVITARVIEDKSCVPVEYRGRRPQSSEFASRLYLTSDRSSAASAMGDSASAKDGARSPTAPSLGDHAEASPWYVKSGKSQSR